MEKLKKQVSEVPLKKKQKLLDLLHQGKTIGEARKEVDLDLQVVGEIIMQNIGEVNYLKQEAI